MKNRHRWVVDEVGSDGSLTLVDEERGRVTLPRGYVTDAVTLGNASTAMAGQGRTVDHSLVLVDGPIDAAGLYVPMTPRARRKRRLGGHRSGAEAGGPSHAALYSAARVDDERREWRPGAMTTA